MKSIHQYQLLKAIIFSLLFLYCSIGKSQVAWDFTSLLERTCQFNRLYEEPGYRTGMASSYDRTLGNNDGQCIREENGRYLMADLQGPGAVMRLWSANPTGEIWIYLDGASEPVIHTGFRSLFLGGFPPFVGPFVHVQRKEEMNCYHWAYIPIPFAKSCRIYRDKLSFFQASYILFPAGTKVEPFSMPLTKRHQETIGRMTLELPELGQSPATVHGHTQKIEVTVPAGKTVQLAALSGPAVIRAFRLEWPSLDPQAGRMALLTMIWDDETTPSVRVPLSDFFGSGFKTLPLGVADGKGYFYFPMPFQKYAKICVANESKEPMNLTGELVVERDRKLPTPLRTFHADWHRTMETKMVSTRSFGGVRNPICNPQDNFLVTDLRGRGHYVATMHHRYGRSEGDEFVFVDGEPSPGSIPGTGNEDYFNMAWGPKTMDSPWAGGKSVMGVAGCFRAHLGDAINFDRSLRFTIEVLTGNNARYDYDATAYWYQEEPHAVFPELLPAPARRFRTLSRPPEGDYFYVPDPDKQGWWLGTPQPLNEGEDLEVFGAKGQRPFVMDMLMEGPDWTGGKQLCQQAKESGESFTVKLPQVESDGWHELTIRWTTGPEYGKVRLQSNCPYKLNEIECYAPIRGAKEVLVGSIQRHLNDNAQLTVEFISGDQAATSAWIGIDWLAEKPTAQSVVNIQMRLAETGQASWQPCPKLPPPTPEQMEAASKRQRALPPADAVAPATVLDKAGEFILRATLNAPANGLYRLDWRSSVPPPPSIKVNDKDCELDTRRFISPGPSVERPRWFNVMLNAGDNEVVWRDLYTPGQWMAPMLMGVEPTKL